MRFAAAVDVMPKAGISDPEGATIERALPSRGFSEITDVRVGKRIELVVEASSEDEAHRVLSRACEEFLTNPIIEEFHFTLKALSGA